MVRRWLSIFVVLSLSIGGMARALGDGVHRPAGEAAPIRQAGLCFVSVGYGDANLKLLVDTGAGRSVVDSKVARRLGLSLAIPTVVQGVSGRQQGWELGKLPFTFAGADVRLDPLATDLGAIARALKVRFDGVLGLDFFEGRMVEIDARTGVLRIRGGWDPAGSRIVELERVNDAYCIRASVASKHCLLRLDTGCQGPLKLVAAKMHESKGGGVVSGSLGLAARSWKKAPFRVAIRDLKSGEIDLGEVAVSLHSRPFFSGEGGLIGLEALKGYRVVIDVSGRRMALIPDR